MLNLHAIARVCKLQSMPVSLLSDKPMTTPYFPQRLVLLLSLLMASAAWSADIVPPPQLAAKLYNFNAKEYRWPDAPGASSAAITAADTADAADQE